MPFIEASLVLLLGAFLLIRVRRGAAGGPLVLQLLSITIAAWIADELAICFYGQHAYTGSWTWWADAVPAVVPFAWALLVLSGWDLARSLLRRDTWMTPWLAAAVVLVDTAVIGPLGSLLGAWQWTEPGLFGVSPVLPVAAAALTASSVALWSSLDRRDLRYWYQALAAPAGLVAAHATGWATWTLIDRFVPQHPILHVAVAWLASAVATAFILAERWYSRPMPDTLPVRMITAAACSIVLVLFTSDASMFVIFSLSTAMLYGSLTPWDRVFSRLRAAELFRLPVRLAARPGAEVAPSPRPRAA